MATTYWHQPSAWRGHHGRDEGSSRWGAMLFVSAIVAVAATVTVLSGAPQKLAGTTAKPAHYATGR